MATKWSKDELDAIAEEAEKVYENEQGQWWATFGQSEVNYALEKGAEVDVKALMDRSRAYAWKRVIKHLNNRG